MAFSGHYLYGESPNIENVSAQVDSIPLYTEEKDILLHCDKAIKIVENSDIGTLYAGAIDPNISDKDRGKLDIPRQKISIIHDMDKGTKNTVLCETTIDAGEYGTILEALSFSAKGFSEYSFAPGEKNQTTISVVMDLKDGDNNITPISNLIAYINQNWRNLSYNLSRKTEQVSIPSGKHTISLVVSTNNGSQEGHAYFEINSYSFHCIPQKCKQNPSRVHITDNDRKEYILCTPGT